jgi:tryptophan synthase alpha chain
MNLVESLFQRLRFANRKAFMPFVTAGDPDLVFTAKLLPKVAEAGADLIEVGFPFSDPIADGPVIQASYTRALDRGLKLDDVFRCLREVTSSPKWNTPVVGMISYSLIWRHGPAKFIEHALSSGLSGVVVPDLPAEEADEFAKFSADRDFKLILLWTPTTTPQRAEKIVKLCSGFLYCVSVVGITGERDKIPDSLQQQLRQLHSMTDLPLCVGFGVSRPEHVKQLREFADGVIVGSALMRKLESADHRREDALDEISSLVRELAGALRAGV